jgi:hypothetical protein
MTRALQHGHSGRTTSAVSVAVILTAVVALLAGCGSSSASTPSSSVAVSGTANGWTFHSGQSVTVSMGPNKIFKPNVRLNIVQCADPGGTKANLPVKFASCDEDTIQANTILPAANGSFSYRGYAIYQLPSATLGEGKTYLPICNTTHKCVLYVGEDQTDFTKPKVFSHAFVVTSAGSGAGL